MGGGGDRGSASQGRRGFCGGEIGHSNEPASSESESVVPQEVSDLGQQEEENETPVEELSPEVEEEQVAQAEEEQSRYAFANYREDDFKPPSYEEMEEEMAQLRARRETFPEIIGKTAFESGLRDEEIEEAWSEVEKLNAKGNGDGLSDAFARLGRAVMAAGITDPSLDDVREEEQEISDRMLNLQMQLRRMGGGRRVKHLPVAQMDRLVAVGSFHGRVGNGPRSLRRGLKRFDQRPL